MYKPPMSSGVEELMKYLKCTECDESFRSEVQVMAHFMTNHEDKIKRRI